MSTWAFDAQRRESVVPHEVAARVAESNVIAGVDDVVGFPEARRLHAHSLNLLDRLGRIGRSRDREVSDPVQSLVVVEGFGEVLGKLRNACLSVRLPLRDLSIRATEAGRPDLATAAMDAIDAARRSASYLHPERFARRVRAFDGFGDPLPRARDFDALRLGLQQSSGYIGRGDLLAMQDVVLFTDSFAFAVPEVTALVANGTVGPVAVQELAFALGSFDPAVEFWRRLLVRPRQA